MRSLAALVCLAAVLCGCVRRRAGLSGAADPRHHRDQRRRHQRHLHAGAGRGDAQGPRPADRDREPARRRLQHRRAGLRGSRARRLHDLHPSGRAARVQPVPVQVAGLRSGGVRAGHAAFHHRAGAGGRANRSTSTRCRAAGAVESEARHAQLFHRRGSVRRVLRPHQARVWRRHRQGAVPRRRRGGEFAPDRRDAGRLPRPLQCARADGSPGW